MVLVNKLIYIALRRIHSRAIVISVELRQVVIRPFRHKPKTVIVLFQRRDNVGKS